MKRSEMETVNEINRIDGMVHPLIESLQRGTLIEDALNLYRMRNPFSTL